MQRKAFSIIKQKNNNYHYWHLRFPLQSSSFENTETLLIKCFLLYVNKKYVIVVIEVIQTYQLNLNGQTGIRIRVPLAPMTIPGTFFTCQRFWCMIILSYLHKAREKRFTRVTSIRQCPSYQYSPRNCLTVNQLQRGSPRYWARPRILPIERFTSLNEL